jgi:hypothetical protein
MTTVTSRPKGALWTGRIFSILTILFMLLDAIMKVAKAAPSMKGSVDLGWPEDKVQGIGIILLVSTILYAIPRTALLGAILLTAYLGGAVSIMMRAGQPWFFPVVFAILTWGGLYLRDERVGAIILPLPRI